MEPNHIEDRIEQVALEAAEAAGAILSEYRDRPLTVDAEEHRDLKLEVDRLCEGAIVEVIRDAFTDHAILTEESGQLSEQGAYRWIIDPLDGTVNFFYGLPYYCVSVACYAVEGEDRLAGDLAELGRPVVGVVYAPPTDEMFLARRGQGATLNGRTYTCPAVAGLAEAGFGMGFGKTDELGRHMVDVAAAVAPHVRKLRCLGAAAYDLSNVSAGRLGGFYERALRTWDIAAGAILLSEAGAALDARQYEPSRWRILAAAPGLIDAFNGLIPERPED